MISIETEGKQFFLARVDALLDRRLFDEAQMLAEERLQQLPDDIDARITMCKLWTRLGKLEQVQEILQTVEERIADWGRVYAVMGDICRESGLHQEAVRFYRRFLILDPQGATRRTVSHKLEELSAADNGSFIKSDEEHYDDIADVDTEFYTMTLADLYLRQNQWEMARNVLKEILRREPDHTDAMARLRDVESRMMSEINKRRSLKKDRLIRELSRWLSHIGRMKVYAA